jgi:DNA topoisomerase-2
VWNNGVGIPVVEHKDEKMFVPTMIFGHLLTSSNYNDEEEKVTGGRNGYGAKLCNIFSSKFTVETSSKQYKRAFKQVQLIFNFNIIIPNRKLNTFQIYIHSF